MEALQTVSWITIGSVVFIYFIYQEVRFLHFLKYGGSDAVKS